MLRLFLLVSALLFSSLALANPDPLERMVNRLDLNPYDCWVGDPPIGWEKLEPMFKLKVENETSYPIRLTIDGRPVVMLGDPDGRRRKFPLVGIVEREADSKRSTFLEPGKTCYGRLPGKGEQAAEEFGWSVQAVRLSLIGPEGSWVYAGDIWLYTTELLEGPSSDKPNVRWRRGQKYSRIEFKHYNFGS